jgi:hypothetical protein
VVFEDMSLRVVRAKIKGSNTRMTSRFRISKYSEPLVLVL